jgi:transposase
MKPEKLFNQVLGLGAGWEVTSARYDAGKNLFELHIRETDHLWELERCPHDDSPGVTCYDHVPEMRWRHLNLFDKESELICALPRGKCPQCQRVYRVHPPWEGRSGHFTPEFEAFALTLMREMPVSKASEILGETDTRMWRMLHKYVDKAYANLPMDEVTNVGVDEMSRAKRHRYLSVFCDMDERRVLFATPGKDAATWDAFCAELLRHNGHPHAITSASMDMSPAYQSGVKSNCRNAVIVFDKFHVIMNANKAVDKVRRAELRKGDAATRGALAKSRWLWLKNPANLTECEQERLGRIDQDMLVTATAYQMRMALQNIYNARLKTRAKQRLEEWCRWVRREAKKTKFGLLQSMVNVAKMIERHLDGVLAHWDNHTTNAFLEGLNSVFSAVKRKARGYRSDRNMIAMLYFVAGKLPPPEPVFH